MLAPPTAIYTHAPGLRYYLTQTAVWFVYGASRHVQQYLSYIVEEYGVPWENYRPVTSHWQTYHIMLYRVHPSLPWTRFKPITLVLIGTDCTGSCESNYHTIMTMTAPNCCRSCVWFMVGLKQRICNLVKHNDDSICKITSSIFHFLVNNPASENTISYIKFFLSRYIHTNFKMWVVFIVVLTHSLWEVGFTYHYTHTHSLWNVSFTHSLWIKFIGIIICQLLILFRGFFSSSRVCFSLTFISSLFDLLKGQ